MLIFIAPTRFNLLLFCVWMSYDIRVMLSDQPTPPRRTCGAMIVYQAMLETVPGFRERQLEIHAHAQSIAEGRSAARQGLITIPVVVHVVYNTPAQNISDDQVNSQIEVLNADYGAANPDIAGVPAPWQPLISDSQIRFALATEDPDGSPTTGIHRVSTTAVGFHQAGNSVKSAASGGADAWDTSRYLNIWVCNLLDGLLGYAQFPGGPAATDGVVILYSAFGSRGTLAAPYNLGRSATHEVGHFLNLFHIWGDTQDCSGTDYVADTPNAQLPNFGKPAFPHVTCGNAPNGDMFMNYMDYVDDDSMFFFTSGQVARMRATLSGVRAGLG